MTLDDYLAVAHLAPVVRELVAEAARVVPNLGDRTVWMINSTSQGGGVAEMLPTMVQLLRGLGIRTEWVVIESDDRQFFRITKAIHNLIHGDGNPRLGPAEREVYEGVNEANADFLRSKMKRGDILVVHDPQPMPLAAVLAKELDLLTVWRCHIGLDDETPATRAVWEFLSPYGDAYHHAVFSAPEYIPRFLAGRSTVIFPAINPLTDKNRELHLHKVVGILANSAMAVSPGPLVTDPYARHAQRVLADGQLVPANQWDDIGLLTRPIVAQVSRWDRLKGFLPLMRAFAEMKRDALVGNTKTGDPIHGRRLQVVRLVLAGPDPESVEDDPEGKEVFHELSAEYGQLAARIQEDIAILALPMASLSQNALMVNALQRSSTIVVQNSVREGFGLTVTEAMWKRVPILTNTRACGPRQQIRDDLDGRLIDDPEDRDALARALDEMLADAPARNRWGRTAQRRAHDKFLIFAQLREWIHLLSRLV